MSAPKIGQTEDGHSFLGGDPSKASSWKPVGSIEDGHIFKGGDPSVKTSWEEAPEEDEGESILSTVGEGIMNGVTAAGNFVDSYTGAPTRAAIGAAQNGENPLSAFGSQFGADPALAPTGKEIAQTAGFSSENAVIPRNPLAIKDEQRAFNRKDVPTTSEIYSPAGIAGLGIDIAADPTNFIPLGLIAKSGIKATGKAAKGVTSFALRNSVKGAEALLDTKTISNGLETTGKYIDEVMKSTKDRFSPKIASDFSEFAEIAKKNGIDPSTLPESVEFGPQSTITKKSKVVAEGPAGEPVQARYMRAQADIENALDTNIKTFTGGVKPTHAEAGNMLLEGYNKGIKQFFDQDMLTHSKVVTSAPGANLTHESLDAVKSKITGLKNKATGRVRRGMGGQREEAASFLADVDILERSLDKQGNLSYKRGAELLSNIGEEAFKKYPAGTKVPTDQKALQGIYFSLRDSMIETAGHILGPDAATELAMNNTIISDFLKEKGRISKVFEGDLAPEKLFKRVADSGDTKQINALKEILSPEDFDKFKGAYLDNLVVRNGEGSPLYRSTMNRVQKNRSQIMEIYSPEEVKDFGDILRLGDRTGSHIFNSSNTNTASRFGVKAFAEEILSGGVNELTLEKLKDIARNKAKAIEVPFTSAEEAVKVTPTVAQNILKQIPLLNSKMTMATETGRVSSVQERNREIEKRKRAISGSK